jgi:hypothetical protein
MTRKEQIVVVLITAKAFFGLVMTRFMSLLEPEMFRMAPTHKI